MTILEKLGQEAIIKYGGLANCPEWALRYAGMDVIENYKLLDYYYNAPKEDEEPEFIDFNWADIQT